MKIIAQTISNARNALKAVPELTPNALDSLTIASRYSVPSFVGRMITSPGVGIGMSLLAIIVMVLDIMFSIVEVAREMVPVGTLVIIEGEAVISTTSDDVICIIVDELVSIIDIIVDDIGILDIVSLNMESRLKASPIQDCA